MKKLVLFLGLFVISGVQSATAQTWEDAYAVPNMLGDGGLLQPNILDAAGTEYYNFQQHATKICENNSVIPRDRLGFHFDALQTVPVFGESNGPTINRNLQEYRFWFEKTFLDENLSVDLILPLYYSTGDSQIGPNPTVMDGQFGQLAFGLKALLWEDQDKAYAAGVRVEAPTGPNFTVTLPTVVPDAGFEMDAWYFTPWLGGQWTPGPNWFASAFVSYRLNSGALTNERSNGFPPVDFRQPTYLFADLSIGRWIVQREGQGGITSLAPVLELHYTTTPTAGSEVVGDENGTYASGILLGKTDYLNLTAGLNGTYNDAWQFGIGAAMPLRTNPRNGFPLWNTDRTFSWALLANLNYYFR